jgi:hypothetical protein
LRTVLRGAIAFAIRASSLASYDTQKNLRFNRTERGAHEQRSGASGILARSGSLSRAAWCYLTPTSYSCGSANTRMSAATASGTRARAIEAPRGRAAHPPLRPDRPERRHDCPERDGEYHDCAEDESQRRYPRIAVAGIHGVEALRESSSAYSRRHQFWVARVVGLAEKHLLSLTQTRSPKPSPCAPASVLRMSGAPHLDRHSARSVRTMRVLGVRPSEPPASSYDRRTRPGVR